MSLAFPLINGTRYSYCDIEVKVGGFVYLGVTSINYKIEVKHEKVYGTHPDPLGRTRGQASYTSDMEMLLSEFTLMIESIGIGWAEQDFTIDVTYGTSALDTLHDQIIGTVIDDVSASQSNGDAKAITRKITLNPLKILLNGLDPLFDPLKGLPLPIPSL